MVYITTQSASPKSVIKHVSDIIDPMSDQKQSIDKEEKDRMASNSVSIKIEPDNPDEEGIKEDSGEDNDCNSNMQQTNLTQCHIQEASNNNDYSVNRSKSSPSIIRVSPTQKSQLTKSASQALPSVAHIISPSPITNTNSSPATISTTPSSPSSSPSSKVASISDGSSSSSSSSSNSSSGSSCGSDNASQNNLTSNAMVKVETGPTKCNILSKTAASSSKKSPLFRSDLVASSLSALRAYPSPTRPLLMSHNQYQQFQHNHLATTMVNAEGKNLSLYKFDANKSLATNVSSQLILSSIITANPMQKSQQLGTSSSLSGLQLCLGNAPSNQTLGKHTNGLNPIEAASLMTVSTTIASESKPVSTITSSKRPATAQTSTPSSDAIKASTKSKSKGHLLMEVSSDCSQANNPDNLTHSPGASCGIGPSTNAAAARLMDLGKQLLDATRAGNVELVRQLVVDSGAPFTSDWLGTTALHIAAQHGFIEIADILIRGGVNRDARTKLERTALHLAAQSGCLEIVDSLITRGADVNGRDMLKMTPLHWAVERGHICVVERLLLAGADIKIKSKFQLTPVDMANNLGSYDILELFKTWTGGCKDEENIDAYSSLEASLNESQDFLDIDYHLALVNSAADSRGDSMLDNDEPCMDLVEFEWNKFDFEPELFLSNNGEDEAKVEYLTKIVEELQKENQQLKQQLRQRVDQLNEKSVM